jgi:hypothetical protein
LDTIYSNFVDALPVVQYCRENGKRLIHFSTCEVYGKTIGSFLPNDSPLKKDPAMYLLKEDETPCIFGSIDKQRWSYACAKQLIERLIYGELLLSYSCHSTWELSLFQAMKNCHVVNFQGASCKQSLRSMKHLSHSLVSIADVNPSLQMQTLSGTWKRGDDSDVVTGVN